MNRKNFAFSWGRKMFFGLSWPLSCLIGLLYMNSFIFPGDLFEWIFFITAYMGIFGVLNAAAYFLFYSPFTLLFSGYYISRIWSLLIILVLNLLIFSDAFLFSSYLHHLNSYLFRMIIEEGLYQDIISNAVIAGVSLAVFIVGIIVWFRGALEWKSMQGRFSNPVKNWYLALIFLALVLSGFLYVYTPVPTAVAGVLPLAHMLPELEGREGLQELKYPVSPVLCTGKNNPNFVLIVFNEWTGEFFSSIEHLKQHGTYYNSHVAPDLVSGSTFSLMYSIPYSYRAAASETKPAFMKELEARNYHTFSAGQSMGALPFFLSLNFNKPSEENMLQIQDLILVLQKQGALENTHILVTAGSAPNAVVPLLWINPARTSREVTHVTSHYDVMPTLMENFWKCRHSFKAASTGVPLDNKDRDWLLTTGENHFKILDLKSTGSMEVRGGVITYEGTPRKELIFPALKQMNKFYRP